MRAKQSNMAPSKLPVSSHLSDVFRKLPKSVNTEVAVLFALSLGTPPTLHDTRAVFGVNGSACEIPITPEERSWAEAFYERYQLDDAQALRRFISHRYTHLLPDSKKSSQGKYYSPSGAIRLVRQLANPFLDPSTLVVDLCVGCAAFAAEFSTQPFYGFDIDPVAIQILKQMGLPNVECRNSLALVERSVFKIPEGCRNFIIVGNPPYNDKTSLNRRHLKQDIPTEVDPRVDYRDMGVSFMRAYFLLKPRAVIVLHPFTYVLKRTLFHQIANQGYHLEQCTVFPSTAFATHGSNVFPYCVALWTPRDPAAPEARKLSAAELDEEWSDWRRRSIPVVDIREDTVTTLERSFRAADYATIDEPATHICKYTKNARVDRDLSDIDLYVFSFRDMNSLLSSGNFTNVARNGVAVNLGADGSDLFKYCALNAMKRHWRRSDKPLDYILGNLSPIYPKDLIETPLRFPCLIDAYFNSEPKFQPGSQLLKPWFQALARQYPDVEVLRRFVVVVVDGQNHLKDALWSECRAATQAAVARLR